MVHNPLWAIALAATAATAAPAQSPAPATPTAAAAAPAAPASIPAAAGQPAKPAAAAKPAKTAPVGPAPAFDSTRAFGYLKAQCAFGPRTTESVAHQKALEYFLAHFRGLGFAVKTQAFTHADMQTGHPVPLTNVIVTIPGRDAKRKAVVFCGHWDSRPRADQEASEMLAHQPIIGANDGASGAAVLMELANGFKKKAPLMTIHLVLFDGEDYGKEGNLDEYFLGARYFAENMPIDAPEYALLLDMIGDRDLHLPMEQNSLKQSPALVAKIWARAKSLGITQFEARPGPNVLDDHMPLQAKGIAAVDIIDFDYPAWHTQGDTPDKCSAHSLGAVGRLLASLADRGLD